MSTLKLDDIPNQKEKIAIVTGANAGLGFETTLELVKKEIKVIMACRNLNKGQSAKNEILKQVPKAKLEIIEIDLSELDSVREFVKSFLAKYNSLDLLINNAGVMMPPYQKTKDGFELQMAANYFGHFLLTGLLIDIITKTENSRIISLSSIAHKNASINFEDLQSEQKYSKFGAYAQSKLACLIFSKELQRRLEANKKTNTISIAAHPGASNTELARHLPKLASILLTPLLLLVTHSPRNAAKPTLLASLSKNVDGADYYGPQGFMEMNGNPGLAKAESQAYDVLVAKRLWEESEKLTGINFLSY
ncbi:oxidoreductase [Gillisia hiemivivida]|uniref:SDR family NAD(P)-dependent oxidoreductase n=1 Tax=Gillisia hiemivivida TaxID=291190 RepID=A0A5C6ZWI4_9FLAO|nr:oxidoreductase [Gillisia hiemivivida]TXD94372.1 SDR family NAD(P)-dependent oxidoreductase [Gillisia hiemivivida]